MLRRRPPTQSVARYFVDVEDPFHGAVIIGVALNVRRSDGAIGRAGGRAGGRVVKVGGTTVPFDFEIIMKMLLIYLSTY